MVGRRSGDVAVASPQVRGPGRRRASAATAVATSVVDVTDASADPRSHSDLATDPARADGAPAPGSTAAPIDLDAIERDLAGVDVALNRLADGTYWTDEVTGETIPEHVLVRNPIARRA